MKRLLTVLTLLLLVGCKSEKLARILGSPDTAGTQSHQVYMVACCKNTLTGEFPAFVPQEHVNLCRTAEINHGVIGNDTYQAMHVDCGTFGDKIGDQYYVGKGY